MSSEDISNLLAEAGVLKDKKAFMKRLGELGVDSRLKIGSFEIPKGSGYDDIIKILTR
jgi:cell division protein YceG involved in septum cleavage